MEQDSAFEFPCEIPVKVFGHNDDEFIHVVTTIVKAHFVSFSDTDVSERLSRNDRYLSLTVRVFAESREQIDALYTELSGHESILMVL
ncbi:MAG: DUF493 domain-containing protein [Gammaproteobacteria bacterium]|nr:DUF493 domain-containing protein [Gammaproteobacteria bacterium]